MSSSAKSVNLSGDAAKQIDDFIAEVEKYTGRQGPSEAEVIENAVSIALPFMRARMSTEHETVFEGLVRKAKGLKAIAAAPGADAATGKAIVVQADQLDGELDDALNSLSPSARSDAAGNILQGCRQAILDARNAGAQAVANHQG